MFMVVWLMIGVASGITMGRRGHDAFTWMVLGATLGPLVVPLALSTQRRHGSAARPVTREWPQSPSSAISSPPVPPRADSAGRAAVQDSPPPRRRGVPQHRSTRSGRKAVGKPAVRHEPGAETRSPSL
jgi:hypothetical protein